MYHFLEIHEVTVADCASMFWLVSPEQHSHVVTDSSEGEGSARRGPGTSGGRAGPLAFRK